MQSPLISRIHYIVPLGAGRDGDVLTAASIARLDEGIKIAVRENADGMVALGDYFSTWRQGEPYNTKGSVLRAAYLTEHCPPSIKIVRVDRGSCTLQELVALRDVGHRLGIERMIIVTHPEHVKRVERLSEMIFQNQYFSRNLGIKFIVRVESGDLPSGKLDVREEEAYLEVTEDYLRKRYPPNGEIPSQQWGELDPPVWWETHVELYDRFRSIYQKFHEGREAPEFYRVAKDKERE